MSQTELKTHAKLNRTGDLMPLIGFGTARIKADETEQVIYNAIKVGYRMIDGALLYGNEAEVGKGVRRAIQDGLVKREDLFIVGKLWNNFHGKDHVREAFDVTLENYGLDYIDLYLVHFPLPAAYVNPRENLTFLNKDKELPFENSPMQDCWRELEKLVDAGLVRNIGISNFNVQLIIDLLTYARIRPAVLEIEHHPYLQQKRLVDWVKKQDIHVIAYGSFGNAVYTKFPKHLENMTNLLKHPVVLKLAEKYQRDAGQIVLTWAIQRDISVIPKSVNVERMKTNLNVLDYQLKEEDMQALYELEANARFNQIVVETFGIELPIFD